MVVDAERLQMTLTRLRDRYAIVGIGYTPQGVVPDRSALSFYVEAGANAIKDAGLTKEAIDGLICYRQFQPVADDVTVTPYLVAQHLGITPTILSQESYCARTQFLHALAAIETGFCTHVLVVYGDNAYSGKRNFAKGATNSEPSEDLTAFGEIGRVAQFAMAARRAMHEFGTGPETWREIAVAQRRWAQLNPRAMLYKTPLTPLDYDDAPWVVEPFRLPDCCLVSDGGRACVVTTAERARDLPHPVVTIMGIGEHNTCVDIHQSQTMAGPTGAREAGAMAFDMAGLAPKDIDACQIYDCFSYTVEITLQDYGFFGPGEAKDWFRDGATAPGGRLPVNTGGGLLAESYCMGMTPVSEAVMQLMGRCDHRQLGDPTNTKPPEIILCSDNGAVFQSHATLILRRH
jgi:acetyl-CoA acetyltransferase